MTWLMWVVLALCLLAIAAVCVSAFGARRWANATLKLVGRLEATRAGSKRETPPSARFDARELEGLPAPVQRYFRTVLTEGQPIIVAATVELAGRINLSATGEQWKLFTSRQRVVTHGPGFLWDAKVAMLPGVPVRVVDSYIAGQGRLRAAALGLFTVGELHGDGEIARGELMRYFAEMAWYPTALLPSQGVQWSAVDERSADATLVDGPLTLTLRFNFNEAGLIDSAHADARGAMVDKVMVMLPWEGRWSGYQRHDGMLVPTTGHAAWLRSEGGRPYFSGTVTSLAYEFSSPRLR